MKEDKNKANVEGLVTLWLGKELKSQFVAQCKSRGMSQSAFARFILSLSIRQMKRVSGA